MSGPRKGVQDRRATVPIGAVRKIVRREIDKSRHYRNLPYYIVFLSCLGISLFTRYVPLFSDLAPFYTTNSVKEYTLRQRDFDDIASTAGIYEWLEASISRMYDIRDRIDEFQVIPLGLVAVRQMRTTLEECFAQDVSLLLPTDRDLMPKKCPPALSINTIAAPPFGRGLPRPNNTNLWTLYGRGPRPPQPSPQPSPAQTLAGNASSSNETATPTVSPLFKPLRDLGESMPNTYIPTGPSLFATNYNFVFHADEFVEFIFFSEPRDVSQTVVDWMRNFSWIDQSTKAIAVDTMHFDKTRSVIMQVSFVVEMTTPVNFDKTIVSSEAPYLVLGTPRNNYLFFTDVATLIGIAFLVVDLATQTRDNYRFGKRSVFDVPSFWWLTTLFLLLAGLICFGLQMQLWAISASDSYADSPFLSRTATLLSMSEAELDAMVADVTRNNALRFYEKVSVISNYVRLVTSLSAAAFIAAGFKLFDYLSEITGLNLITETLRYATRSLLSLGVIMFGMLVIFATSGVILFGSSIREMRTFPVSFSFLSRVLISQELDFYDRFSDVSRVAAAFFFGTFFVLFWLILLNSVLGIIAQAFEVAEEERKRARANPDEGDGGSPIESIRRAVKMHFMFLDPRFKINRYNAEWNSPVSARFLSSSVKAAHVAAMHHPKFWIRWELYFARRTNLMLAVMRLGELDPAEGITYPQLCEKLHYLHILDVEMIFERAWALQESRQDRYAVTVADVMNEVSEMRRDLGFWLTEAHPELSEQLPSAVSDRIDAQTHDVQFLKSKFVDATLDASLEEKELHRLLLSYCSGSGSPPSRSPTASNSTTPPFVSPTAAAQQQQQQQRRARGLSVKTDNGLDTPLIPVSPARHEKAVPGDSAESFALLRTSVVRFYEVYAPEKLAIVESVLQKFNGAERALLDALRKKYGAEPSDAQVETARRQRQLDALLAAAEASDAAPTQGAKSAPNLPSRNVGTTRRASANPARSVAKGAQTATPPSSAPSAAAIDVEMRTMAAPPLLDAASDGIAAILRSRSPVEDQPAARPLPRRTADRDVSDVLAKSGTNDSIAGALARANRLATLSPVLPVADVEVRQAASPSVPPPKRTGTGITSRGRRLSLI